MVYFTLGIGFLSSAVLIVFEAKSKRFYDASNLLVCAVYKPPNVCLSAADSIRLLKRWFIVACCSGIDMRFRGTFFGYCKLSLLLLLIVELDFTICSWEVISGTTGDDTFAPNS